MKHKMCTKLYILVFIEIIFFISIYIIDEKFNQKMNFLFISNVLLSQRAIVFITFVVNNHLFSSSIYFIYCVVSSVIENKLRP